MGGIILAKRARWAGPTWKIAGLMVAFLLVAVMCEPVHASPFSGSGSGTPEDPYIITTVEQLQEVNDDKAAHYALGNDIDASATIEWNEGAGFIPIGDSGNRFTGSLDGKGYKITNLFINRSGTTMQALFGMVNMGGVVENVGLENENVTGANYVGGLMGHGYGTISNCYSTGSVSGVNYVGGLVGQNNIAISNSYSTCSVSGGVYVGGLVGLTYGDIINSYSTGSVSATSTAGGLLGKHRGGSITNCFWDIETSGQSTGVRGTGKTTEEMKNVRTFTDPAWSEGLDTPWDFIGNLYEDEGIADIWNIDGVTNDGYPFLMAFAPPVEIPTVATSAATNVEATAATLNGQISDGGGEACEYRFRYKKADGEYSYTTWTDAKTTGQTFYEDISELDSDSLYYFNAQAKNSAGESDWGNELSFVTINNIWIVGNDQFDAVHGVNGGGTGTAEDPYIIENWTFDALDTIGIHIENTTAYFVVQNCLVENGAYHGIHMENVINGRIENNIGDNIDEDAFTAFDSSNITFSNNTCENNFGGIFIKDSSNIAISNNTCSNNSLWTGIMLRNTPNSTISNNTCSNNTQSGIYLESSYDNLTNNICEGNDPAGGGFEGICLLRGGHHILDNNTSRGNSRGIRISASDYNTLTNNTFSNNIELGVCWGVGIYMLNGSKYNTLDNNTYSNNASHGIYLHTPDNNIFTHNTCENNDDGINLHATSFYNVIDNNTFSNNRGDGIDISQSSYTNVTNNTCENNANYGIHVHDSVAHNTFTHNYLLNNTVNNAYDSGSDEAWDVDGVGNWWSDWQPPEHPDTDADGIAQNPRPIEGGDSVDHYPLVPIAGFGIVAAAMFIFPLALMGIALAFDNPVFASFAGVVFLISGVYFIDTIWLLLIFIGIGVYLLIAAFMSEEEWG